MRNRQTDHQDYERESSAIWVYWGASGILQPLSDEFLYRSPTQALRGNGSCRLRSTREVSRATG